MQIKGLKVEVIFLAFLLTIALVFGGQWLLGRYQVERPLLASARKVDGVKDARLEPVDGRMNLVVTMGPARDFRASHDRLLELLDLAYGRDAGKVVVHDNRTAKLTGALYEMNFALQEGLATGRFTEMRAAVVKEAHADGLATPYLWVDADRIYLGLKDKNHVLYDVVERKPANTTAVAQEGSDQHA
ncbi:MAG: hypothetical protein ACM3RP_09765 [Chitinophagales bacterium]